MAASALNRLNSIAQLTPDELRLLVALGPGSFVLASTIGTINVGLPAIQDDFDVSLSALKWVSIMGSIMMASMSLCFGRIGDIVGRRRIYRPACSSMPSSRAWQRCAFPSSP